MKYRKLGKKGPTVSALGLGCMGMSEWYGPSDEAMAKKVLEKAFEEGITFYDTADVYGKGANELLLSNTIKPFRNKITLATKCGIERFEQGQVINNTKKYIKKVVKKA